MPPSTKSLSHRVFFFCLLISWFVFKDFFLHLLSKTVSQKSLLINSVWVFFLQAFSLPEQNFKNFLGCMLNLVSHTRWIGCLALRKTTKQIRVSIRTQECFVYSLSLLPSVNRMHRLFAQQTEWINPHRQVLCRCAHHAADGGPAATPSEVFSRAARNQRGARWRQKEKSSLGSVARHLFVELVSKAVAAK